MAGGVLHTLNQNGYHRTPPKSLGGSAVSPSESGMVALSSLRGFLGKGSAIRWKWNNFLSGLSWRLPVFVEC